MGPRSFNRGNRKIICGPVGLPALLQWGRGLSTAEIAAELQEVRLLLVASMGPRSFNRGNNPIRAKELRKDLRASMGPRSFNRGNFRDQDGRDGRREASMGPRSFNRGNSSRARHGRTCHARRFNGAAVFQPRKWPMEGMGDEG